MSTPFPPRWRRRWRAWRRRSSFAWWTTALVLALVTGTFVRAALVRSSAVLHELGPLRPVPVVARAVDAGEVVEEGDVVVARRPSSMVPDGELDDDPTGRVALVPLIRGEVAVASKFAPDGLRGAAALLPEGMRAVAVPGGPGGRPPVSIGDRVDVLATLTEETVVVAAGAVVLAVANDSDAVTVAVPPEEAPALAHANTTGAVTLALTSP